MKVQRGDVVLVDYPFSSGSGKKLRPALVIQNDRNNHRLTNTIVVAITRTVHRTHEPAQLFIAANSPEGQQSGLLFDSAVTCENIATVERQIIRRKIGNLPANVMSQVAQCLMASLDLP
jgi:mRNA interferase MazF